MRTTVNAPTERHRVLTNAEMAALRLRYRDGDLTARDDLVLHNLALVRKIASTYMPITKSLEIEDLEQYGVMGLLKAIDRWDPERGAFSTCAVWWIRQAITRSIAQYDAMIRSPVYVLTKANKARHKQSTGEALNAQEMEVLEQTYAFTNPLSLDAPSAGDDKDLTIGMLIRSDMVITTSTIPWETWWGWCQQVRCSERDAHIAYLHTFGLCDEGMTLQTVADQYGVSRERVRQLCEKVYRALRGHPALRELWEKRLRAA